MFLPLYMRTGISKQSYKKNGSPNFPGQDRVRIAREMLGDYFFHLRSQGTEDFIQQNVGGGFPRCHKFVRIVFEEWKRAVIRKLASSRSERRGIR